MTTTQCILSEYLQHAMAKATYDKLEDGTYVGKIPECTGVIAFGTALRECERSLQSVLEDWLLLGLKLHHPLPVLDGIDLNGEPVHEPMDTL